MGLGLRWAAEWSNKARVVWGGRTRFLHSASVQIETDRAHRPDASSDLKLIEFDLTAPQITIYYYSSAHLYTFSALRDTHTHKKKKLHVLEFDFFWFPFRILSSASLALISNALTA